MEWTRLAPSPTGALHLGNARTFLVNWALARQRGWKILLRIEDLDGPRIKREAAEQAVDILGWLGIDWDAGPLYQTSDLAPYRIALGRLAARGLIYPCRCTRTQILAASLSAPHGDEHELRYPGTCRPPVGTEFSEADLAASDSAWRLRVPEGEIKVQDEFLGAQQTDVQAAIGDFLVTTKGGLPSYQLAVVVDDARQDIGHVVRGDDLLPSTPRQKLLYECLQLGPTPRHYHVPLVKGSDGKRLAKRHGDTRVSAYREHGTTPERIIGLLAEWCGMGPHRGMNAEEFSDRFDLAKLPRGQVTFTEGDDRWLKAQT